MPKEMAKRAGLAVTESVLQSLMPELHVRLEAIRQEVSSLRSELHRDLAKIEADIRELKQDSADKFEQTREVINELGHRVAKVEGAFEQLDKSVNRQTDRIEVWIERVVKVEMSQTRRRRAG